MRIDELDSSHKEFKQVILNQELTEEQLDEVLPAIAAGLGRAALAGVSAVARGAAAVGRGVASAGRTVGKTVEKTVKNTAGGIKQKTDAFADKLTTAQKNKLKAQGASLAVDTADKLSQKDSKAQGTQGTQGTEDTIGTDSSEQEKETKLGRGQTVAANLGGQITPMKVKGVSGKDVELEPIKKQPGSPSSVKFNKKDLSF